MALQGGCVSALQEKLKYTKDGFCCLVVTSASEPEEVRGAVEISLQGEKVSLKTDFCNIALDTKGRRLQPSADAERTCI